MKTHIQFKESFQYFLFCAWAYPILTLRKFPYMLTRAIQVINTVSFRY